MANTIDQMRQEAIDEFGFCDLGDGELAQIAEDLSHAEDGNAVMTKQLAVLDVISKRLENLTKAGNVKVDVDSEPLRKTCDALTFALNSVHERVEKTIKHNSDSFASVNKSLEGLAKSVAETAAHHTTVTAPTVNIQVTELTEEMKRIANKTPERHEHVHKVAAPVVNLNGFGAVAKAIGDSLLLLSQRQPEIIVEGTDKAALQELGKYIIEGCERIAKVDAPQEGDSMVIRDNHNQLLGSEIEYEYQD